MVAGGRNLTHEGLPRGFLSLASTSFAIRLTSSRTKTAYYEKWEAEVESNRRSDLQSAA